VLIGQAVNTGVQALAVCLRGMTLGDLRSGRERMLLIKEMLLGTLNGALTGVTGGIAMFIFATDQKPAGSDVRSRGVPRYNDQLLL
jgi:magnesium transporter